MGREERSFDQAYREFLPEEQRREVLKALREKLAPETTFGQIVDAARSLGWEEALGEVLLSELASTLLNQDEETRLDPAAASASSGSLPLSGGARKLEAAIVEGLTNWSEDQDEPVEQESLWQDEDAQELAEELAEELAAVTRPKRGRPAKKKSSKKKTAKKRASKKKASKTRASKKKATKKRSTKKKASKKRASKKKASKKRGSKKKAAKTRSSKKKVSKTRSSKKKTSKKRATKKKASKKRGKKKSSRRR